MTNLYTRIGSATRTIANPRPGFNIQDLAFHYDPAHGKKELYVLTGYYTEQTKVFEVDPDSADGTVTVVGPSEGVTISGPHGPDPGCDGFTVLPNGNFLINDGDGADNITTYREYDASTGNEVPGGLTIDVSTFAPDCYGQGTGVALAPDGQSLYFMVSLSTLIQTDLQGKKLLGAHDLAVWGFEDIDVVVP